MPPRVFVREGLVPSHPSPRAPAARDQPPGGALRRRLPERKPFWHSGSLGLMPADFARNGGVFRRLPILGEDRGIWQRCHTARIRDTGGVGSLRGAATAPRPTRPSRTHRAQSKRGTVGKVLCTSEYDGSLCHANANEGSVRSLWRSGKSCRRATTWREGGNVHDLSGEWLGLCRHEGGGRHTGVIGNTSEDPA